MLQCRCNRNRSNNHLISRGIGLCSCWPLIFLFFRSSFETVSFLIYPGIGVFHVAPYCPVLL